MKKIFFALLLCMLSLSALCQLPGVRIDWNVGYTKPVVGSSDGPRKGPAKIPTLPEALLEGNVLSFIGAHAEYTLYIIGEHGDEVYEMFIPENMATIALPLKLSGEYKLVLDYGSNYYYSIVTL